MVLNGSVWQSSDHYSAFTFLLSYTFPRPPLPPPLLPRLHLWVRLPICFPSSDIPKVVQDPCVPCRSEPVLTLEFGPQDGAIHVAVAAGLQEYAAAGVIATDAFAACALCSSSVVPGGGGGRNWRVGYAQCCL